MTELRQRGTIKRILVEKGFGFIVIDDGGYDLFFFRKDLNPMAGALFPSTTCICTHAHLLHESGGGACAGGITPGACGCQKYQRRLSPKAIYVGQRVSFLLGQDARGPKALDVSPDS